MSAKKATISGAIRVSAGSDLLEVIDLAAPPSDVASELLSHCARPGDLLRVAQRLEDHAAAIRDAARAL